jgi:hypothetical protein
MRVRRRAVCVSFGVAWAFAAACNLNPRPEDPGREDPTGGALFGGPRSDDGARGSGDASAQPPLADPVDTRTAPPLGTTEPEGPPLGGSPSTDAGRGLDDVHAADAADAADAAESDVRDPVEVVQ